MADEKKPKKFTATELAGTFIRELASGAFSPKGMKEVRRDNAVVSNYGNEGRGGAVHNAANDLRKKRDEY
jgi:hypothetical protein